MASQEIIHLGSQLITKDFGLDETELADIDTMFELESRLEKVVQYLLDKDFQRLVNAMYRIDLPESQFKAILATAEPDKVAQTLSKAILDREMEKAALRLKYRE
ncbi:MAG: hypothetical protein AAGC88_04160 [Bacteroidota bacterium]